ncbi:MFS transporter [Litoreibacter arenae]|uniref:Permease of the major facilitator superfamily n=1 Tax=Litoreibacter arenae DSM 19593 TaxID=1123360 RepID=S9QF08_9RHOB|nr:Permease of the major facilitator superfamily [Litoreibacter arenae]EPX80006.1 Permease of the major facilitator superfamily [Litoreibacter arenae DSM 19593]
MKSESLQSTLFELLVENPEADGGLTEGAKKHEPRSFLRHAAALGMTKLADGLIDPKLVLSWLLTTLGAPAFYVGLLVPIREAGALLPQLALASWVEGMAQRKWAWVAGAVGQGASALAIVLVALSFEGALAGGLICVALAVLALSRSLCSVSYKDILGETVAQSHRGSATGIASSTASAGVIVFALLLMSGVFAREGLVLVSIGLAACLWGLAALVMASLHEEETKSSDQSFNPLAQFRILREDAQLRRFIVTRGLLVSTALAPPYMILLAGSEGALSQLGALVLASALASLLSSYVWGRLSDRSSRLVLLLSGVSGSGALVATLVFSALGLLETIWALPLALFALMIAYHGVRQGRSTYLVDMSPEGQRAAYTAVSNTVIGVLLLASGAFGALAGVVGPAVTLLAFALMAAGAAFVAYGLEEAEHA